MHDEQNDHSPARTELRNRLNDGLARARLNKTQLAQRGGLGRTTVQEAFRADSAVPSAETVAALARALQLPVGELLELQRAATKESGANTAGGAGPGKPIGQWEPHELEVHPAGPGKATSSADTPAAQTLPGYVRRGHDQALADAVRDAAAGRSRIVVLVGTSSTGKTRACWEAVQPLAKKGWRLWHPFDPTRAEAALEELHRVKPRTVVWLNEAQHYLGDQATGERIAAAVHQLLIDEDGGPVLVLGTLWPEYAHQYTVLPTPGGPDPHSRVRELLAGRTQAVPEAFDIAALAAAAAFAEKGDRLLADALTRARDGGRITQDLAGAPELLRRYEQATPPARALLDAAMDARRLGVSLHLPQAFLIDATSDYLTDTDYDQLTDDWAERAFAELAELVHGKQAPLRRATPRTPRHPPTPTTTADHPAPPSEGPVFRLADYLEQHGRTTRRPLCPPASFWHSAHTHLTHSDDLEKLTRAAVSRHRLQWAHRLHRRAADHGNTSALIRLAKMREVAGDGDGAEALAKEAAARGDTGALMGLVVMREVAGDRNGAEALAREVAADHGDTDALLRLAVMRRGSDRDGAEALARQAADHGDTDALVSLAKPRAMSARLGDTEAGARQAADHGNTDALASLAVIGEEDADPDSAEAHYRWAADHGNIGALLRLAEMREEAGDRDSVEALYRQAANYGTADILFFRSGMRLKLVSLWPYGLDPDGTPTPPW
ncbi:helix-turn-helix domain-containing protein [Streptomyces avermitilis]|uniref:helix-turn-helix domain-containing protein n=1 Tax=Streptomyces avermitilis TaxID=33903 RepID=UPI0033B12BF5